MNLKFRKKPVVIKAVQFTEAVRDAFLFDGQLLPDGVSRFSSDLHPPTRKVWSARFYIKTPGGHMEVSVGDWIITDGKGERYACKPDIFDATYEAAYKTKAKVTKLIASLPNLSQWRQSAFRQYRYALWRHWGSGGQVMFIGLNPSNADATRDDPTIRRCVAFAKSWGFGSLCMTNLFAFRAANHRDMLAADDPVGHDNDYALNKLLAESQLAVAAWGCHGTHMSRDREVRAMLPGLHYLRLTKGGHPSHPLYLPKTLVPTLWEEVTK